MSLLSPDHETFRLGARQFVDELLTPNAEACGRDETFPRSVFRGAGEAGLLGLTRPIVHGGRELDVGYAVVLAEELPRCRTGGLTRSILAPAGFFSPPPSRHGAEEQKAGFLAPAIRGDQVGARASTEPTGGSAITGAVQCAAAEDGDSRVVSGEKRYVTNGIIADFAVALVRTRPDGGPNGMSLLLIPTDTPGFAVKQTLPQLGLHTSPTGWLAFDRCRIPKTSTIGKPHLGYYYHTQKLLGGATGGGGGPAAGIWRPHRAK